MPARPTFRSLFSTLLTAGLLAQTRCAGAASSRAPTAPPQSGTVITQEKIAASGAKTAWDAIRLTVPNIQLRESRGKAARIQRRGRASIYLDDQVRVIVDNVRLYDLQQLQHMPATDILTIRVFTGLDATTYYGGTSTSGVIVITTTPGGS
jgi:outer membrane receptor for ferrienterochelin and colicin